LIILALRILKTNNLGLTVINKMYLIPLKISKHDFEFCSKKMFSQIY